jgi:curved DNA-binding protein CbpA
VRSYESCAPAELYREAITCFGSLMDISQNTAIAKEFARREDMDLKYLVDGANFVISKLHFNHENNYYVTLGLAEGSSQEEIRERWKRLMLLYHPDLQAGNEEWVSERAKKVNEAYTILKDPLKRRSYDLKLRDQRAAKPSSRGHHPEAYALKSAERAVSVRNGRQHTSAAWSNAKKNLPRVLIGLYILGASVVLAIVYYHRDTSSYLEKELQSAVGTGVQSATMSAPPRDTASANDAAGRQSDSYEDARPANSMVTAEKSKAEKKSGGIGPATSGQR